MLGHSAIGQYAIGQATGFILVADTDALVVTLAEFEALAKQINKDDADALLPLLAEDEQRIRTLLLLSDADTLVITLDEKIDKWFNDPRSARFLKVQADITEMVVRGDAVTLRVTKECSRGD